MKKISIFIMFIILLVCSSCYNETNNNKEQTKRLTIQYFDNEMMFYQGNYSKEEFELEEYSKDDYTFDGWYLDDKYTTPFEIEKLDDYFEMKVIALYAKMSKIMKSNNILVIGKINDKIVLNPSFVWENTNEDTSYKVTLYNGDTLIMDKDVETEFASVNSLLNINTTYTLKITGNNSNYTETINFETGNFTSTIAELKIDNPFMSNMVIQRNAETVFSGVTGVNQLVTLNDGSNLYYGVSDNLGNYEIKVPGKDASFTPSTITLTNGIDKEIKLENVLYGDVYLFAGQSNMQWPTMNSDYEYEDLSYAKKGNVRYFSQDVVTSVTKVEEVKNGKWFIADNNNVNYFSAIAFMSGSLLSSSLKNDVPIGIVTAYQGDTNIVNWMGEEYYSGNIGTKYLHYNAMVYPLRHTKLSGLVWYQGCNNSAAGGDYKDLLLKLFDNYRDLFNCPDLPFFVIGLCCYDGDSGNNYDFSYVRESQVNACLEDDNAYFISTCDDGDPSYIHPKVKRYICKRVSKSIQSVVYDKDYLAEGPIYKSNVIVGSKVIIDFYNSDGLYANGEIKGLYLAGEDGKYYEAIGAIKDGKLEATSDKVAKPVYVKYGFSKSPFVNIFNKDNFAVAPFRTDDHNTNIDLLNYNTLEDYYFHPDGSNMDVKFNNGNLSITKANDGKTYGSVRLDVWGMIAYLPEGFNFTLVGTNSNASISFRIIEGSYEIWAYKVVDNFIGEKSFNISAGEFSVVYNKEDGILNTQKVNYIEIMVEAPKDASFEVKEARFVNVEKTIPQAFTIASIQELESNVKIAVTKSIFADSYKLKITSDALGLNTPIIEKTSDTLEFSVNKALFSKGNPYYVFITAINDLGEKESSSNGTSFYLKEDNSVIICNFDFATQESLNSYMASSMDIHSGLTVTLEDEGIKILSSGAGWQQFIFKLDTGAGKDMTTLKFKADFRNYKGTVVLQLADTSWQVYEYVLPLNEKDNGEFVIDFSNFKTSTGTIFTTQNLMWVMFNFNDTTGNGYILFDDCILTK